MLAVNDTVRDRTGWLGRVVVSPFITTREWIKAHNVMECVVEFKGLGPCYRFVEELTKIEPVIRPPAGRHEQPGVDRYGAHAVVVTPNDRHGVFHSTETARIIAKDVGAFGIWRVKHRHMPVSQDEDSL